MTEETKAQETVDVDEVKKLHAEIQAKETQTIEGVKRDVAEAVKKEIRQENDLESIKKSNEELQEALAAQAKAAEESLKKMQDDFNSKIEDINTAQKSIRTNQNPFEGSKDSDTPNKLPFDVNDRETMRGIEEESRKAFVEKYGVDQSFGRPN
jgi:hypothetical protein